MSEPTKKPEQNDSEAKHSTSDANAPNKPGVWVWILIPLLLLGGLLGYLLGTGGGLNELKGPPVQHLIVKKVILPEAGTIRAIVVNDGPEPLTIAQVQVDEAYWKFSASPDSTLKPRESAVITIPYHWVNEAAHELTFVTSLGVTFSKEIPVAVQTPTISAGMLGQFALVGVYVGIIPVLLGVLMFPALVSMGKNGWNFALALTVGLLAYLAIGTYLDAVEFAEHIPSFWQGTPMILLIALLTIGLIQGVSSSSTGTGESESRLTISYRIAFGIGLHNLGEGLAIGAAYASGEAALGTFLIIGFALHNLTEGVGIAAPLTENNPGISHWSLLILLAGAPAILGTWLGGFAFDPVLATVFMAIGLGAILQVIWDVGKLISRQTRDLNLPLANWTNLSGLAAGITIMYLTGFLVKF